MIDVGSYSIKMGSCGEDEPTAVFPSLFGTKKFEEMLGGEGKDEYFGKDAQKLRGLLKYSYPVERGNVEKWDQFEKQLKNGFVNDLRIEPSEFNLHLTECVNTVKTGREKQMKMCFEKFECPGFYISVQPVLALYAIGNTTGLAMELGDGVTQIVPVCGGFTLRHAAIKLPLAGRDITEHLMENIYLGNFDITDTARYDICRQMKEEVCRLSMDYKEELPTWSGKDGLSEDYKLPDGHVFKVKGQCITAPEILFTPSINYIDLDGLHQFAKESIKRCDIDLRPQLCANINIAGGNSLIPGLEERLGNEQQALLPEECNVSISANEERRYLSWQGGSLLSTLESFESMWITKEEYQEHGSSILQKKIIG